MEDFPETPSPVSAHPIVADGNRWLVDAKILSCPLSSPLIRLSFALLRFFAATLSIWFSLP